MDNKLDVTQMPSLSLAFVGDSVYEVMVREYLSRNHMGKVGQMNKLKVALVCCKAQAQAAKILIDVFTEEETGVYRRGRNVNVNSTPKNSTLADYHSATGLEAVFGYLYLSGRESRCRELFKYITDNAGFGEV